MPYKQAQKLTRGFNHKIEAHKILEWRHAQRLGLKKGDLPAVILSREQHKQITKALQNAIKVGGGTSNATKPQIWKVYQRVYKAHGYSDWLQHIEHYFR